ncbi:uncharacterized protein METZ01_LOCUS479797, partial [marine metagenome]
MADSRHWLETFKRGVDRVADLDEAARPELLELGQRSELGIVPQKMHVFCVRQDRF